MNIKVVVTLLCRVGLSAAIIQTAFATKHCSWCTAPRVSHNLKVPWNTVSMFVRSDMKIGWWIRESRAATGVAGEHQDENLLPGFH